MREGINFRNVIVQSKSRAPPADADARSSSSSVASMPAAVTRGGEQIFVGQARGIILAVDAATGRISDAIRVLPPCYNRVLSIFSSN